MSVLDPADMRIVSELLGADIARRDAVEIAASIADLRADLPAFRRVAAEVIDAEEAEGD